MCLYEGGTFLILSRQGGIPLETNEISAKAEQKSPYKCFFPGWAYSRIMWLNVVNNKKKTFEYNGWIECWTIFDILLRLRVELFLNGIGRDLLNKYDVIMEKKVVHNEELMECMRVIYVRSSRDFKIAWKEKCMEKNNLGTGNRYYCISTNKVNTTRTSFKKQASSIWNMKET